MENKGKGGLIKEEDVIAGITFTKCCEMKSHAYIGSFTKVMKMESRAPIMIKKRMQMH